MALFPRIWDMSCFDLSCFSSLKPRLSLYESCLKQSFLLGTDFDPKICVLSPLRILSQFFDPNRLFPTSVCELETNNKAQFDVHLVR